MNYIPNFCTIVSFFPFSLARACQISRAINTRCMHASNENAMRPVSVISCGCNMSGYHTSWLIIHGDSMLSPSSSIL
ncbi:hypothetical protein Y032_0454g1738 [Ancylostoma ceylanicum]|uniref:Secreted protein n=1 Tax=Ancylostoma ceylanicum TaxID=53326 RepID=A0A016X093_9BILA|nr:hypothetical protein Y032_0454g1738 [Ancylostoma ceylanicum]